MKAPKNFSRLNVFYYRGKQIDDGRGGFLRLTLSSDGWTVFHNGNIKLQGADVFAACRLANEIVWRGEGQ